MTGPRLPASSNGSDSTQKPEGLRDKKELFLDSAEEFFQLLGAVPRIFKKFRSNVLRVPNPASRATSINPQSSDAILLTA